MLRDVFGEPVPPDREARIESTDLPEIPADVRERVLACKDLDELNRWIRRAAVVGSGRELFAQ